MDNNSTSIAKKHEDLGIKEFVAQHRKIVATFKERYSDFHVHELAPDGKKVQLTDLNPPKEKKFTVSSTDPDLIPILSEEVQNQVQVLHELVLQRKRLESVPVQINVTQLDKQQRTKIHRWVANYDGLGSSTIDKDDQKYIVVEYATPKSRRRPETRDRFTHCILYKEGMDTSDAILSIAKRLRMNHNLITYAGTKDKQAKTTQRISVTNVEAKRLIDVSKQNKNMKLGNFEYASKGMQLGDLTGNHFEILLKDVKVLGPTVEGQTDREAIRESIESSIKSLKEIGFINYFGLQRFGSYTTSTHAIGKAVLQMKWDRVFDLILEPKPRDTDFMIEAKKLWFSTRDAQKCLKLLPNQYRSVETNLFHGLARHYEIRDFLSAFQRIPRNVRALYLHAFQSYLWNHVATFRVQKFGLKPIVGDFVNNGTPETVMNEPEEISLNITDEKLVDTPEVPVETLTRKFDVKILKEEDLDKYTIYDVLIPLFGTELVRHPNRVIQDCYDKLLLDQGLDTDCFLKFKPRHEAPKGSYRQLIIQPKNVDYKVIPYGDSDNLDKFIQSDLDLLRNSGGIGGKKNSNGKESGPEDMTDNKKEKICVVVEFSLPSASYATMTLREILEYSDVEGDSKKRVREGEEESETTPKKTRVDDNNTSQEGGDN